MSPLVNLHDPQMPQVTHTGAPMSQNLSEHVLDFLQSLCVRERERKKERLQPNIFWDKYSSANTKCEVSSSKPKHVTAVKSVTIKLDALNVWLKYCTLNTRPQKDGLGWEPTCLLDIPMVEKSCGTQEKRWKSALTWARWARTPEPASVLRGNRATLRATVRLSSLVAAGVLRNSAPSHTGLPRAHFLLVSRSPIKSLRHHRCASAWILWVAPERSRVRGPKCGQRTV